ncbi:ATP-binding Cassette (ABC) Superfamily [Phytophthora cinnamomi]|uniref:ATP-binding Cassette (ABC) Superfamily n=1 Tax=Phytophthora cinnamomi TaxID=4785 RepID=UPI00355A5770|nr:ATP-binding Cassette (ABC) Superfamily [Phytophthora cinnamomi]
MMRVVLGGERKRIATCEMEFGMKYVVHMDEISTGLDSAALCDIMKTQRSIDKKLQKAVDIALLHPASDVFDLFDNHFESRGSRCAPKRVVVEYLLNLGANQQHQSETESREIGRLLLTSVDYTCNLMCSAY